MTRLPQRGADKLARVLAASAGLLAALAVLFFSRGAQAYPWMIRHEYTACAQCHTDPSGGGILTQYGQAQGDILLRTRYGESSDEDIGPGGKFLLGAFETPDALLLGGSLRMAGFTTRVGSASKNDFLFMQGDLRAQVRVNRFRASGSVGVVKDAGNLASVVNLGDTDFNLVSREFWLGVDLGEENQWLLRAGRINMPYGIRNNEHTMWVRESTGTDINDSQQYGVALAYSADTWRAEILGIVGNYQLSPDNYRERGYAGYIEHALAQKFTLGVSSLVTYADRDVYYRVQYLRQVHGLFARYSPYKPLVVMAQADALIGTNPNGATDAGLAGLLQFDIEAVQGVHLMVSGEVRRLPEANIGVEPGAWLSAVWFALPKVDFRVDGIVRNYDVLGSRLPNTSLLGQFHLYL